MALPVDGSADCDLPVKGLTTEKTIGPDHEEPQEDPDGELMMRMRMKACTLFDLAKKSCKLGHMQKQKAQQSDGGNCKKARSSHVLSQQWFRPSQQQQELPGFAGLSRLISHSASFVRKFKLNSASSFSLATVCATMRLFGCGSPSSSRTVTTTTNRKQPSRFSKSCIEVSSSLVAADLSSTSRPLCALQPPASPPVGAICPFLQRPCPAACPAVNSSGGCNCRHASSSTSFPFPSPPAGVVNICFLDLRKMLFLQHSSAVSGRHKEYPQDKGTEKGDHSGGTGNGDCGCIGSGMDGRATLPACHGKSSKGRKGFGTVHTRVGCLLASPKASRVVDELENSYRTTLRIIGNDPADRDELLSKCHTRCAQRLVQRLLDKYDGDDSR